MRVWCTDNSAKDTSANATLVRSDANVSRVNVTLVRSNITHAKPQLLHSGWSLVFAVRKKKGMKG